MNPYSRRSILSVSDFAIECVCVCVCLEGSINLIENKRRGLMGREVGAGPDRQAGGS
jgi:hypothetical protein